MIDLREKDRLRIIDIAKRILDPGCEIWAYGSRVKGTNYDASDLDLAIITPVEQPLDPNILADFKLALQDSNIPILIQVMDWQRIPESFRQNILTRYEVLLNLS